MCRILLLFFVAMMLNAQGSAQVIRYRIGANSGMFLSEIVKNENQPSLIPPHEGSRNFTPVLKPGAELEVMVPFTPVFEVGLQFGFDKFSGATPVAPAYNFFFSKENPTRMKNPYPGEALIYDTHLLKFLLTGRWYFLPDTRGVDVFVKYFGGISFIGTDFSFADPYYQVQYAIGKLYSRGTINSDYPKVAVVTGGAGLGFTYRLSDRFDLYFDATSNIIHSDIINGVPNFKYVEAENTKTMERTNALTAVIQGSAGIIFSAIPDRRMSKNNVTRSTKINRYKVIKKKSGKSPYKKGRK